MSLILKYFLFIYVIVFSSYLSKVMANDFQSNYNVALLNQTRDNILERNKIPYILNPSDVKYYKAVFDFQEKGQWSKADKILNFIDDKILMGHVIYHRLMHPSKYRASYHELADWLLEYRDHPGTRRAYKLALRRKPNNVKQVIKPEINNYLRGYGEDYFSYARYDLNLSEANTHTIVKQVNFYISKDELEKAYKYLLLNKSEKLPNKVYDSLIGRIAIEHYYRNDLNIASDLFKTVATNDESSQSWLSWWAGLNEFRKGSTLEALKYFKIVVKSDYKNDKLKWQKTAAAYWVGRIYLKLNENKKAIKFFKLAASQGRSFYSHLARENLGYNEPYSWKVDSTSDLSIKRMLRHAEAKRAIALSQVGRYGEADFEIRNLYGNLGEEELIDLLRFSELLNLPAVQIRLGSKLAKEGVLGYMRGLYPAPNWDKETEFMIDRALLFALIRKESAFYLRAKSKRGARGLMQLMPRTARLVSGDTSLRGAELHKLYLPKVNLSIGQNFIRILMKEDHASSSLIHLLGSYNAGPSRMDRWEKKFGLYDDPLLFIESIPITETQLFIKAVLSDIWTYRDRFSQEKPSRKELASGDWPMYISLDGYEEEYGKN